jgi:DNA-binding IclR family transcriptional regulator
MAPAGKVAERQRASYSRRAPSEVAGLGEKVLEAVQACPGETMTTIAARVGEKPRALHRPMRHLKEAGRVRSAGERNFTRYYPMTGRSA